MITKPATLVEDYDHIFSLDPALDHDADDFAERYERYLETGRQDELPLKAGQQPAVFRMRHLRGRAKRALIDFIRKRETNDFSIEAVASAAALSVQSVTGFVDEKGRDIELAHHIDRDTRLRCLTDDCLAMLDDVPDLVNDLGLRAIRSMTPEGK